jgi:SAM-dependent methyltransferase
MTEPLDEDMLKAIAAQLRQPHDEMGIQTGERMNRSNEPMYRFTFDHMRLKPHDKVMEIGMGNGHFVQDVLSGAEGVTYTGCDFSGLMVSEATARNIASVSNNRASFIHTAADALPFPADTFDLIFTINTVYFWEHPEKELTGIRRVLKPGGELLITIRTKESMIQYPFTQYGFTLYTPEELIALMEDNGFRVVESHTLREPDLFVNGESMKAESFLVKCRK